MAEVSCPQGRQGLRRRRAGGEGHRPRDRRPGVRRAGRPVRLRQVHHAAHDRRPGGDHRRRDLDRRRRGQRRAAARPRHRHGVPELRAVSAHERVRQHGVRPEAAEVPQGRDQAPGGRGGAHPRHRARCWTASRRRCPAASGSASRWAAPSCATRRCSCSTSRCPTWTPSCACRCAPRSRRCTRRCSTTTVYVTHDQVEAMTLADRVVVMNHGVIEQVGPPQELYHNPATRFVAGFIGSPGDELPAVPRARTAPMAGWRCSVNDQIVLPVPPARVDRYGQYKGQRDGARPAAGASVRIPRARQAGLGARRTAGRRGRADGHGDDGAFLHRRRRRSAPASIPRPTRNPARCCR